MIKDELCIKAEEVLADIRSAAWLEQELHPEVDRHRRHQMADICEGSNAERVWRVLGNAVAEVRMALLRLLKPTADLLTVNELTQPDSWTFFPAYPLPPAMVGFLREKIHEYLVAMVMADRAEVIIPGCAPVWRDRAAETLSVLRQVASTAGAAYSPVHRPIWPL